MDLIKAQARQAPSLGISGEKVFEFLTWIRFNVLIHHLHWIHLVNLIPCSFRFRIVGFIFIFLIGCVKQRM